MAEHIAVTRVDTRAHCGVVKACVRQAEYQVAVMWGKRSEIWYGDGDTRATAFACTSHVGRAVDLALKAAHGCSLMNTPGAV